MYGFYIDWTYIIIVLPVLILALICQAVVKSTYTKYSKVSPSSRMTGAEAARKMLSANGCMGVGIANGGGKALSDYYDPKSKNVLLSGEGFSSASIADIAVSCHECGHALQDAESYGPLKFRTAIVKSTNACTKVGFIMIIVGMLLASVSVLFTYIAYIGVILYGAIVVFQLVTLPVEFNASKRAVRNIESLGILKAEEMKGARAVLNAAAMTYVASLATSLAQLLRFVVLIAGSSGRRRR